MSAVEAALAVSERVRGGTHLPKIFVGADVYTSDHLQIIIQHLVKIAALLTGFRQDHRQMQADSAHIEASDKYRLIVLIRRVHSPALIPGAQKRPAAHRTDHAAVLLIHARHIALAGEGKPVRIHGLCGALQSRLKHILARFAVAVQVLIE